MSRVPVWLNLPLLGTFSWSSTWEHSLDAADTVAIPSTGQHIGEHAIPREHAMQKICPCLWFDDQAEDAASFYVSIFRSSAILDVSRYGEGAPRPAGSVMMVTFVLDGLELQALNGGPE